MQTKREFKLIQPDEVGSLLIKQYSTLMTAFYEFQSSFCQILSEAGNWVDQNQNIDDNRKIENAILNKAKKIRLSKS